MDRKPLPRRVLMALAIGVLVFLTTSTVEAVTLKFSTNDRFAKPPAPPKVGGQIAFSWLKDEIEKRTGGDVQVEIYWGETLGNEKVTVKMLSTGVIDAQPITAGNVVSLVPEINLFATSYLFANYDHYLRAVEDKQVFSRLQQIVHDRKVGFQLVGMGVTGTRNFYNRSRPITKADDLKGLKVRVMASPIELEVWSKLEALPSNIASSEIYTSLQTGVVDGAESSLSYIYGNKYYEVAPYIALTNHQFSTHFYLLGDKAIAKIPPQHLPIVLSVFRETGERHIRATQELGERDLNKLREQKGVTVTEPDTKPFMEKLVPIQDKVAKDLGVEDVLARIRALQ